MTKYIKRLICYLYQNPHVYISLKTKPWKVYELRPGHREQRAEL